jgi:hypothetical protein
VTGQDRIGDVAHQIWIHCYSIVHPGYGQTMRDIREWLAATDDMGGAVSLDSDIDTLVAEWHRHEQQEWEYTHQR